MDGFKIANDLLEEVSSINPEMQLAFIKKRIKSINNPEQQALAEAFLLIGLKAAPGAILRKHIIILVHGIRTQAVWQDLVATELRQHQNAIPAIIGFDYFDAFRFWFPFFFRRGPVDRVEREIRSLLRDNPNAEISVLAHSFGTYVVGRILKERPDLQFRRMLLCGSIVPTNFQWDALRSFPSGGVVNDVGTRDFWPALAKATSWGYGASGTFGFRTTKVKDRFHDFSHSDFFTVEHIRSYWLPYLVNGDIEESEWSHKRPTPPTWLSLITILPVKSLIAACVIGSAYFALRLH